MVNNFSPSLSSPANLQRSGNVVQVQRLVSVQSAITRADQSKLDFRQDQ